MEFEFGILYQTPKKYGRQKSTLLVHVIQNTYIFSWFSIHAMHTRVTSMYHIKLLFSKRVIMHGTDMICYCIIWTPSLVDGRDSSP